MRGSGQLPYTEKPDGLRLNCFAARTILLEINLKFVMQRMVFGRDKHTSCLVGLPSVLHVVGIGLHLPLLGAIVVIKRKLLMTSAIVRSLSTKCIWLRAFYTRIRARRWAIAILATTKLTLRPPGGSVDRGRAA